MTVSNSNVLYVKTNITMLFSEEILMKKIIIYTLSIIVILSCFINPIDKASAVTNPIDKASAVTNTTAFLTQASSENSNYNLTTLNIVLPPNWHLDTSAKVEYFFVDDKGENVGWVTSYKYTENFDFSNVKPNHSSIINDEYIDIPLDKCKLFTLDADNGTAASGITGTHDDYYAVITLKDKVIYELEFSLNDKKPQTKSIFIDMLKKLSFKVN